ncbi:MAG TPA: phosphoenolpyruvate carboxykinase (ATP) [Anaerolineales bacterium]|nr:phosphoenolpyruvate carboxykinase (ATP) [Anaerolineales bacterium]
MNNVLGIHTPAEGQAEAYRSDFGLKNIGLSNLRKVYWNLPTEALYEEAVFRREGRITREGPLVVDTGAHTARAASDKYIVCDGATADHVWWGEYNRPFSPDRFNELFARLQAFLQGRDLFVQDCYVGADPEFKMPVRIISEYAWHSIFARNMFMLPESLEAYRRQVPDFTVLCVPSFKGMPQIDSTASSTFVVINFDQRLCIIGDTAYAGEIKKSVFTIMNDLLPLRGALPMHCSANVGDDDDVAIFFGLSGTGKTTLSADPTRRLIGDDEHGWNDDGVFNFEAGCYAKVIQLSATAEPQIFACTRRFGTLLENVIFDPATRQIDLDDDTITENTRASYPLEFIHNNLPEKRAGHPRNIILLTCDASGVMPPIARLTPDQALYLFISGYTAKVGGTEIGLREEPEITFSACFGGPFMVHHPSTYAELLKNKMQRYGANAWLVNTGWIGGPYGVGKRISISHTRALLSAALSGKLDGVETAVDPVFGFAVPMTCPGVPTDVLSPASSWSDREAYMDKYRQLAARFVDNFKKFEPDVAPEIAAAGPSLVQTPG